MGNKQQANLHSKLWNRFPNGLKENGPLKEPVSTIGSSPKSGSDNSAGLWCSKGTMTISESIAGVLESPSFLAGTKSKTIEKRALFYH